MIDRVKVLELIRQHFSDDELRDLCYRLGVNYEDLPAAGKAGKARELVDYAERHGLVSDLVATCRRLRPKVAWPDTPAPEPGNDAPSRPFGTPDPSAGPVYHISGPTTIYQGETKMGDTFNMSGDFRGAILNIKSTLDNVTQTVGQIPHASQSDKDELKGLIEQLNEALQQVPPEKAEEAEVVAEYARELVEEANTEKPKKARIQISGEGLKKAAENIAAVMPTVLTIATQIVATISKVAGA